MPPKSDKRYDAAVKAVLDGHDLKRAWEECGKPGTNEDSALRNIRKRVAAEQAKAAAAAPPPPNLNAAGRGGDAAAAPCAHAAAGRRLGCS